MIEKIRASGCQRDDVVTERARACVRAGRADEALDVLLSHRFVPCEGGEHAVAEPYLYAWLDKGLSALAAGQTDAAADALRRGQVVPDELGAGIWNRCKLVPLRFAEALALEKGGRAEEARAIFADIAAIPVDYFSNMHLGELPYFIALSLRHLGRGSEGNEVMTRARRAWEKIRRVRDNGFFGTTPFFICYIEAPEKLRLALWHYRMALVDAYRGDDESAAAHLAESLARNRDNFPAQAFRHHGFFH